MMDSFKSYFLNEEDLSTGYDATYEEMSVLYKILFELSNMSDDDVDEYGYYLYSTFFDEDSDIDANYIFTLEDVLRMLLELGPDYYKECSAELQIDDDDEKENPKFVAGVAPVGEPVEGIPAHELGEAVSTRMKIGNMNHKKRKFMAKSAAQLRREAPGRKRENRMTRAKRKADYRVNKIKKAKYNKSRLAAIKSGKHIVKMRRKAGT